MSVEDESGNDAKWELAELRDYNSLLQDEQQRLKSTVKRLQLLSRSQTALLRGSLANQLRQRDDLIQDVLEFAGSDAPEDLQSRARTLQARTRTLDATPPDIQLKIVEEVKHLREENATLASQVTSLAARAKGNVSATSSTERQQAAHIKRLEGANARLQGMLRTVQEGMTRGEQQQQDGGAPGSPEGRRDSLGAGSVPEEKYLRLREKYDSLKADMRELRAALARAEDALAEASSAPLPPPPALQQQHQPPSLPAASDAGAGPEPGAAAARTAADAALAAELDALRAQVQLQTERAEKHKKGKKAALAEKVEVDQLAHELMESEAALEKRVELLTRQVAVARATSSTSRQALEVLMSQVHSAKGSLAALATEVRSVAGSGAADRACAEAMKAVATRLRGFGKELAEVRRDYAREVKERKRLFNVVQELRGNIRVFCRCRPPTNKELQEHAEQSTVCVTFPEENIVDVYNDRGRNKTWEFDKVFGCDVDQSAIYEEVSPLVTSCLDGYQVCIFAYGQTGTGKTFTMTGPPSNRGVNTRALEELFRLSHARASEVRDDINVSILEIYNETIQDLLSTANANKKLEVRQSEHGNYVPDLTVVPVTMIEDVLSLMELGDANRSSACTNMNEHSSRSHLMISVQVTSTNMHTGAVTRGKLHLIDLAGSERLSKSGATGQALKEAQNINKSLSALGDVIAARASKQNHVPYRNSTLTYLLQDSLAADSKTLMFVCISPVIYNAEETFCSLNFASRVRTVELGKATVRHALSLDDGGGGGARASARSPSPFTSGSNGSLPSSVGSAQGQFSPVNQSRPRKR